MPGAPNSTGEKPPGDKPCQSRPLGPAGQLSRQRHTGYDWPGKPEPGGPGPEEAAAQRRLRNERFAELTIGEKVNFAISMFISFFAQFIWSIIFIILVYEAGKKLYANLLNAEGRSGFIIALENAGYIFLGVLALAVMASLLISLINEGDDGKRDLFDMLFAPFKEPLPLIGSLLIWTLLNTICFSGLIYLSCPMSIKAAIGALAGSISVCAVFYLVDPQEDKTIAETILKPLRLIAAGALSWLAVVLVSYSTLLFNYYLDYLFSGDGDIDVSPFLTPIFAFIGLLPIALKYILPFITLILYGYTYKQSLAVIELEEGNERFLGKCAVWGGSRGEVCLKKV